MLLSTVRLETALQRDPRWVYLQSSVPRPQSRISHSPARTSWQPGAWFGETEKKMWNIIEIIYTYGQFVHAESEWVDAGVHFWPGQVVKWCHSETGHHSSLPLFGEQFVPHSLLAALGMFNLNTQHSLSTFLSWRSELCTMLRNSDITSRYLTLNCLISHFPKGTRGARLMWY